MKQIERTTDTDRSKFANQAAFCYLSENEERFKSAASADGEADFLGIIEVGGDGSYDQEEFQKAREQYCSAEANFANLDTLTSNLTSRFDQYSLRAVQSCLNSCQAGGLYCNISAENDLIATVVARWNPVGGVNETSITGANAAGATYLKPLVGDDPLTSGATIGSQGVSFNFQRSNASDMQFNLQTTGGTCTVTSKQPELTVQIAGSIWATGQERRFDTGSFQVSQPKDSGTCSRSIRDRPVRRCPTLDGQAMIIQDVWQSNYSGNDATVTQRATDNNQCVTAYITSVDAGRGTLGDCRGRTWLNSLDINYRGYSDFSNISTPKIEFNGEAFLDENLDASFSATYPTTSIEHFSNLTWNFEIEVSEKIDGRTVRSFELNGATPSSRDYTATISGGQLTVVKAN